MKKKKRPRKLRSKKTGLPPGSLIYLGERKDESIQFCIIDYDAEDLNLIHTDSVEEALRPVKSGKKRWLVVNGVHQPAIIDQIGRYFNIHNLVLEDILNTSQRSKYELHADHIYVVLKKLSYHETDRTVGAEQISLIIGKNVVISFQEEPCEIYHPILERLKVKNSLIRQSGSDYLGYALIDLIIDDYFDVLEKLEDDLFDVEEQLINHIHSDDLRLIHHFRTEILNLKRWIFPFREVSNNLIKDDSGLINIETRIFIRDLHDHIIQIIDQVDSLREFLGVLHEMILANINNRMNDIMKILTLITTIFIPLTLITGIYGMNFQYIPGLTWRWSYYAVLIIMVLIGVGLLVIFKLKKWF